VAAIRSIALSGRAARSTLEHEGAFQPGLVFKEPDMADEKTGNDLSNDIEDAERPVTQNRDDQPYNPPSNPPVGMDRTQEPEEPAE
jgi:hypothetical protein